MLAHMAMGPSGPGRLAIYGLRGSGCPRGVVPRMPGLYRAGWPATQPSLSSVVSSSHRYNGMMCHRSSGQVLRPWLPILALLLGIMPLPPALAAAQQCGPSDSAPPSQTVVPIPGLALPAPPLPAKAEPPKRSLPPHPFLDRTNRMLFSGMALFRGLDYASTRNMQARGREEILLPDDVVNNSAGFASLEAASAATSVGASYWMHRTGHHKVERWISIVHIGVTGFGVARNYALESKHPPPASASGSPSAQHTLVDSTHFAARPR